MENEDGLYNAVVAQCQRLRLNLKRYEFRAYYSQLVDSSGKSIAGYKKEHDSAFRNVNSVMAAYSTAGFATEFGTHGSSSSSHELFCSARLKVSTEKQIPKALEALVKVK